jgi:dTDP-4-dehydrorhamnose reductase
MRQLVLVLGANGQLGDAMTSQLVPRHEVISRSREELDVTVPDAVRATIGSICPDVIINCAAYTDVDDAQQNPLPALTTNAWSVHSLARAAADIDATLVHFSTDFVFDGDADQPYDETSPPNPRSTYAVSKLIGEWMAADAPRHYVLRVESLFGGRLAKSSIDRLYDGIVAGRTVQAFVDRTVSPSYVNDVVAAIATLLDHPAPFGLYHCVNSGWTTWAAVAHELARLVGKPEAPIREIPLADANLLAPRPKFAALSNTKLAAAGINMPTWQDALARYVKQKEERENREI